MVQAALHIDGRQLCVFLLWTRGQFMALAGQVRAFSVGLRTHRDILACRHRHGARDKACYARNKNGLGTCTGCRDAQNKACGGYDAIVRAKNGGAEPACSMSPVSLAVSHVGESSICSTPIE
ncbi:hypothetical protein PLCT1_01918 [Planctomycetaceae bacterium]|nr:hypothetical protein PLCT1_01918 [Planctomycetaceae bacterium]